MVIIEEVLASCLIEILGQEETFSLAIVYDHSTNEAVQSWNRHFEANHNRLREEVTSACYRIATDHQLPC